MKRIFEHLEQKKIEMSETPFMAFVGNQHIHPRWRLGFAPCLAPLAMAFSDLNKYVLRDNTSADAMQQILNAHTQVDDSHWGIYLKDLHTLGMNDAMDLVGVLRLLWGDHCKRTRQLVYGLTALISAATPTMRMVILEAIEATGDVAFTRFRQVGFEFQALTGQELHYFGMAHKELEDGHDAMGEDSIVARLEAVDWTPELEKEALELIDTVFALFAEMEEEFLDFAQRNLPAPDAQQARAWACAEAHSS